METETKAVGSSRGRVSRHALDETGPGERETDCAQMMSWPIILARPRHCSGCGRQLGASLWPCRDISPPTSRVIGGQRLEDKIGPSSVVGSQRLVVGAASCPTAKCQIWIRIRIRVDRFDSAEGRSGGGG